MAWRVYVKEVLNMLGVGVYKTFLKAVDNGQISVEQMTDIAYGLSHAVGGEFKRSMESREFVYNKRAARAMLANWFSLDLAKGDGEEYQSE